MTLPNRPWFCIASRIKRKASTHPDLAYDVHDAVGHPESTTAGLVVAATSGTRLTREEFVRSASINGAQPSASRVSSGRRIRSGMLSEKSAAQMIAIRSDLILLKLLFLLLVASGTVAAQSAPESNLPKPGVKEVQVPFASLKASATIKVGGTADWGSDNRRRCLGGEHETLCRTPD
jgi:hypothetical protein